MIDTVRLQVFLHAAEACSFSDAARQMNLTQPTVSHHIKTLERDLGTSLFDRTASPLRLTEAGRLLLPRARKLLRDASELEQLIASLGEHVVGQIRIACSTTTGKYVLPQFAARFRNEHPGVDISILACTQENVVPRLLIENADLGVVSYDACGCDCECQMFFTDHIILIAPADHPWAARPCIEASELLEMPFIIREPTSGTRRALLAELGKHNISLEDLNIYLEVGNAEAIVKTVEAGFGTSFVSHLAAEWALNQGTVVEVPIAGFDLHRKIYMIRHNHHIVNRAVEVFWGFVHDPVNVDLLSLAEA